VCLSLCPSVSQSVRKVYCDKMADWIRMPFGMVSGVGRGMGVSDGVVIVEVSGLNLGSPIVTNGNFATQLFPNYFGQYLLTIQLGLTISPTRISLHRPLCSACKA